MDAFKNKSCAVAVRYSSENGVVQSAGIIQPARRFGYRKRACSHTALSVFESSSGDISRDEKYRSNSQDLRVEVVQGCTKRGRLSERERVASVNGDVKHTRQVVNSFSSCFN